MRAVKLKLVTPHDVEVQERRRVPWTRILRITWAVVVWALWFLWQMTKLAVIVVGVTVGVTLMVIGILTHFVGGPPRWHD
jgi:hypothetical protein